MPDYNDGYCNATVGRLVDVATHQWSSSGDGLRMIVVRTEEPFVQTIVRRFVTNWRDAELLIDRMVMVHESSVYQFPGK